MERPIGLKSRRLVDKLILIALFRFDELQVFPSLVALRIEEDAATRLFREILQRSLAVGESGFRAVGNDINGSSRSLTHVDGFVHVNVASVVLTVSEEENEVASHHAALLCPLIAAGNVKRIEDRSQQEVTEGAVTLFIWNGGRAGGNAGPVVSPLLHNETVHVDLHHECAIEPFANETRGVEANDRSIGGQVLPHRGAFVDEETSADREILRGPEHDDSVRGLSLVGETQVSRRQMSQWRPMRVEGMEGEANLINGNLQRV